MSDHQPRTAMALSAVLLSARSVNFVADRPLCPAQYRTWKNAEKQMEGGGGTGERENKITLHRAEVRGGIIVDCRISWRLEGRRPIRALRFNYDRSAGRPAGASLWTNTVRAR